MTRHVIGVNHIMTQRAIAYPRVMSRWDPDARGRLERAALELFAEQGFADTTVTQITQRAGLTTRTFFRYFADKREVLFSGEEQVRDQLAEIVLTAPAGLSPLQFLQHSLEQAATTVFEPRFEQLRSWRAVVGSDGALRERELRKQQLTTESALTALRKRGFDEQTADMIARLANLVLQTAVAHWIEQPVENVPLVTFIRQTLEQLRSTVA
jgi:AcrR family transcriptional regulator